jgi:dTDP-4-dehydrorhamnose reductase
MKVLLVGAGGQLGQAIQSTWSDVELLSATSRDLDIGDGPATLRAINDVKPTIVINAAAYTDVDGCESHRETAYRVNAFGPRNLAAACLTAGAALVHISTNCVFDGTASEPYLEFAPTNPISVYGHSKLAGELAIQAILPQHYIVRTAWLYSPAAKRNFVQTVLRLAKDSPRLRMVADEIATPTLVTDLALALAKLVRDPFYGVYHLTNTGECSRFDYAREILRLAGNDNVPVEPMLLADFVRPARPPRYSVLRNFCGEAIGITLRPWQDALAAAISEIGG